MAHADAALDALFAARAQASAETAAYQTRKLRRALDHSGSPAMDLLLRKGRAAMPDDPRRAIGHLTALVDHAPRFAQGYVARARAYEARGLFGPAVRDLEQALALEPRHFDAMAQMALILEATGRPELALRLWEHRGALLPHDAQVAEARARLDAAKGQGL